MPPAFDYKGIALDPRVTYRCLFIGNTEMFFVNRTPDSGSRNEFDLVCSRIFLEPFTVNNDAMPDLSEVRLIE